MKKIEVKNYNPPKIHEKIEEKIPRMYLNFFPTTEHTTVVA